MGETYRVRKEFKRELENLSALKLGPFFIRTDLHYKCISKVTKHNGRNDNTDQTLKLQWQICYINPVFLYMDWTKILLILWRDIIDGLKLYHSLKMKVFSYLKTSVKYDLTVICADKHTHTHTHTHSSKIFPFFSKWN